MIPTIEDIVDMLTKGDMMQDKALSWIYQHMEDKNLRDSFAMSALASLEANLFDDADDIAKAAYEIADKMLALREKKNGR